MQHDSVTGLIERLQELIERTPGLSAETPMIDEGGHPLLSVIDIKTGTRVLMKLHAYKP